jgi:hypothetical protein
MKLAQTVAILIPLWGIGCSAGSASRGVGASSTLTDAAASAAEPLPANDPCSGEPYDASSFSFRSSCVYGIASDSGTLSACDEWSQGGVSDWGAFIEACASKAGALSNEPCASAGEVGECVFAPSCTGALVTYFYGEAGGDSFALSCTASVGAVWTPL